MAIVVEIPSDYIADPTRSRPVFNGFVYIGEVDKDPELFPIDIFGEQEDGTEVPLNNPYRLSAGGVPQDDQGNTVIVKTDASDYSMRVRRAIGDQPGSVAYEFASAAGKFDSVFQQKEKVTLVSGQTTVSVNTLNANSSVVYLCGDDVDNGRLCTPEDYTVSDESTIELKKSYPSGTVILFAQTQGTENTNPSLGELTDVDLTNPQDNESLVYDGGTDFWRNKDLNVRGTRNYITDGRFDRWDQGTSQTSNGYGSDTMWLNLNTGSTKTHTQETLTAGVDLPAVDNPTAEFFSRTVVNSVAGALNNVIKTQRIESVASLAGKKANIALYAKADSTKNISIEFVQNFGTGGSPSATVSSIGTNKFQLNSSWARYDFTIDIPSIAGKTLGTNDDDSLNFLIWFDAGSAFDSRTDLLGQQSGTFDIACVQLTDGENVFPFIEEDRQKSLDRVNRYYWTTGDQIQLYIVNNLDTVRIASVPNPTTMRANPQVNVQVNLGDVSVVSAGKNFSRVLTENNLAGDSVLTTSYTADARL